MHLTGNPATVSKLLGRFTNFLLAGALATLVQYTILIALVHGFDSSPITASATGYLLAALVNYLLNYYLTFRSKRHHASALSRFALVVASGLAWNTALMYIFVQWFAWHYLIAQIITTVLVLIWNFTAHSLFSFTHPASPRQ